jgi:hypothetical protein
MLAFLPAGEPSPYALVAFAGLVLALRGLLALTLGLLGGSLCALQRGEGYPVTGSVDALLGCQRELLILVGLAVRSAGVVEIAFGQRHARLGTRRVHLFPGVVQLRLGAAQGGLSAVELSGLAARLVGEPMLLARAGSLGGRLGELGVLLRVGLVLGGQRLGALLADVGALEGRAGPV